MIYERLLALFFIAALFAIVHSQASNGTTEKPSCRDVLESCDLFKEFCGEPSWTSLEGHCDKTCGFCEDTSS
ncbi:unnamed protein product [Cylicocyclus nassatus]|uniref:ShKT domain-containing protein n=1 Tax=Cylicocyclus nassatus TaxID=53992 RepID=A0AA36DQS9_CYLNA|nr:unnamed protein product [Cylicocyclus nassatus]